MNLNGVKNQTKMAALVLAVIQKELQQLLLSQIIPHLGDKQIIKMKLEVEEAQLIGVLEETGMMKHYWQVARKIKNLK